VVTHSSPSLRYCRITDVLGGKGEGLLQIHAATGFASLRIPPGNRMEAMKAPLSKGRTLLNQQGLWMPEFFGGYGLPKPRIRLQQAWATLPRSGAMPAGRACSRCPAG